MARNGGSAQDRRRARRAAARETVVAAATLEPREVAPGETLGEGDLSAVADGVTLGERTDSPERLALEQTRSAFATVPPACSNCDHPMAAHEDNEGACQFEMDDEDETCSCERYAVASETAIVEALISEPGSTEALFRVTVGQEARSDLVQALIKNAIVAPIGDEGENAETVVAEVMDRFRVHLSDFVVDLPSEMQPGETLPAQGATPAAPEQTLRRGELRWSSTITLEGTLTEDGRCFAPGSITWRDLPLTLMAMVETQEGHDGAQVCGRIDSIWRDGYEIRATGVFDTGEFGQEIARMVADGTLRGVSVDTAIKMYDVGPASDWFNEDGQWEPKEEAAETDEPDLLDVLFSDEKPIFVITEAVIGATTVCPFPAFADATIQISASLTADGSPDVNPAIWTWSGQGGWIVTEKDCGCDGALTAAAVDADPDLEGREVVHLPGLTAAAAGFAPIRPPSEWFEDPALEELTPLTVDDDGRIYGHAAAWDTCHLGFPGACTTAPHSETQYAYFLLKEVECDDGVRVPCGTITLEAPHADRRLGRADASAHYDHTGTAVADIATGEDEFGIWVAGALRPDVDAEKVRDIRGAVLSGDWRDVNGNLELVALLAVNVPGFPVPRARALVASGDDGNHVLALVAAGIHAGTTEEERLNKIGALGDAALGRYAALASRVAG